MTTKIWTCTIKNSTTETLQAPNGLDLLVSGNPTGPPPQWSLAPGTQTILQCSVDAAQRNALTGIMTWSGPSGSTQLNWSVPSSGAPAYSPAFTGYAVTADDASPTAVTFTITGGATGATAAPAGSPARVTPTSGSSAIAKPNAPQLWILGDLKALPLPHFNCGHFGDTVQDKLVGEEDGKSGKHARTLQTSGCGLFALSTILGGHDLIVPGWDTTAKAFRGITPKGTVDMRTPIGDSTQPGSPRAFLQFLWHYIINNNSSGIATEERAKEDLSTKILAPDGPGALYFTNSDGSRDSPLAAALAFMRKFHPLQYDLGGSYLASSLALGMSFSASNHGNWPGGTEIKEVTDSIRLEHRPVMVGVGATKPSHQVVVVGLVKYAGKTYYITIDSGFSGELHPGGLLTMNLPLSWSQIATHTAFEHGGVNRSARPNIFWTRPYVGNDAFEQAFDLTLFCKQVREW